MCYVIESVIILVTFAVWSFYGYSRGRYTKKGLEGIEGATFISSLPSMVLLGACLQGWWDFIVIPVFLLVWLISYKTAGYFFWKGFQKK